MNFRERGLLYGCHVHFKNYEAEVFKYKAIYQNKRTYASLGRQNIHNSGSLRCEQRYAVRVVAAATLPGSR